MSAAAAANTLFGAYLFTSTNLSPPRPKTQVIQEGIVLVHDARRFGVSERGLWHLDRLHSRAFQPLTRQGVPDKRL